MTRRAVHLCFSTAAMACVLATLIQGLQLRRAVVVNKALAGSAQWVSRAPADAPAGDRRIVLAHAVALSQSGHTDAALRLFNALVAQGAKDDVMRAAVFDMGNLYLRRGISQSANPTLFLPLLELAKQRYRDVLRADPSDWDARFNLERALRYAPEDKEAFEQSDDRPVERPPDKRPELLAPDLP
jgi:mxaK protein